MLRRVVGGIYTHGFKPVLRPVALRFRWSFVGPMQEEVKNAQAATLRELQRTRSTILQEFQVNLNAVQTALQEVQAAKRTLQEESESTRTAILHELQSTLQEIRATRRVMQQDLESVRAATAHAIAAGTKEILPRLDRVEQYSLTAARRVAVPCGPNEVLVRTEVGYVLCSSSDHAVLACLLDTGDLERGTRLLIERLLGPGDVFVDVGANLGLHTLAAARAMQGTGRIIAFEPFEPTVRLLRKSVHLNGYAGMVEIHQAAVSNRPGRQPLFLGAMSGHHSLYPLGLPPGMSSASVEVPLVTLDDILGTDADATLVKIDVEGAELEVLEGAASLIERNQEIAVIAEFGPSHLHRTDHSLKEWFARFEQMGLGYRVIDPETGILETYTVAQLEQVESANLLFARPDATIWEKAGR